MNTRAWLAKHAPTNRVLVGPYIDAAIEDLAAEFPDAKVYRAPSGSMLFDWPVPNAWDCEVARLTGPGGEVLADFAKSPLAVWANSEPWQETLSAEALAPHLSGRWRFEGSYRRWEKCKGFSLPTDSNWAGWGNYEALIVSKSWASAMQAVELVIPGDSEESILLGAHLCHPGQVADGIGNAAILLDLARQIEDMPRRRYTYRFLFGPEGYAAALWLKHNARLPLAVLYCDMLLAPSPLRVQFGARPGWLNDLAVAVDADNCRAFRSLWGNDERWWEARPWMVPTLGICRDRFPQYHTDGDNMSLADPDRWAESLAYVGRFVDALEWDRLPAMLGNGPNCLSRHGLYSSDTVTQFEALERDMDGQTRTCTLAARAGLTFGDAARHLDRLADAGRVLLARGHRPVEFAGHPAPECEERRP